MDYTILIYKNVPVSEKVKIEPNLVEENENSLSKILYGSDTYGKNICSFMSELIIELQYTKSIHNLSENYVYMYIQNSVSISSCINNDMFKNNSFIIWDIMEVNK